MPSFNIFEVATQVSAFDEELFPYNLPRLHSKLYDIAFRIKLNRKLRRSSFRRRDLIDVVTDNIDTFGRRTRDQIANTDRCF